MGTTPKGRASYAATSAGTLDFTGIEYSQHTASGYTHFALAKCSEIQDPYGSLFCVATIAGDDQSIYLGRNVDNLELGHNDAGAVSSNNEYLTLTDGKVHSLTCSGNGGTGRRLDMDGKTIATLTSTAPNVLADARLVLFGNRTQDWWAAGHYLLHLTWKRQLSITESKSLHDNPWQVFRQQARRQFVGVAAGGGVTVTFAVTDATDTVASTAAVAVAATLAQTDATDTLSATTTSPVTANLAVTDANDTLSSTAAVAILATLATTDATDTVSSTASVAVNASLAATDATDTMASTAAVTVTAALSVTDATDTLAASTTSAVSATLAVTDAQDALSSTAAVLVAVNLAVTDDTDTLSSTAIVSQPGGVIVDLAVTDAQDTVAATAAVTVTAALGTTDAEDTLASTTTSTIVAALALTDAQDTLSASAAVSVVASLAVTDAQDTLDAVVTTAGPVTVTLNVTDDDDTLVSQVYMESGQTGHGGRNAGRMDFRLYDDVDMRERICTLAVTDDDDTLVATTRKTYPDRYVTAQLFDGDDTCESSVVVVPWPALELMREHRLEKWYPRSRGGRTTL